MTGTWRLQLLWTQGEDKHYGHGRKSRAKNKPMARRIKRREHAKITCEAVKSYYEEEYNNYLQENWDDYLDYYEDSDYMYEPYEEIENDYFDDYCDDPYVYGDYAYMDDYYASRDYGKPVYARIIREEDAGKSLGEILEEIRSR